MQAFIKQIFDFVRNIFKSILNLLITGQDYFNDQLNNELGLSINNFNAFLDKNVFMESSLIGINMTFREMFIYVGVLFLTIFFIVLFVKFILKLVSIFRV